MLIVPLHKTHNVFTRSTISGTLLLVTGVLIACTAPQLPDKTLTKEEVPFLGQQMTQEQIAQWRTQILVQRQKFQQTLYAQKAQCYQRFFVNTCLHERQKEFRAQEMVLRKQEVELSRQERILTEIDKQLRLKEKGQ